MPAPRNQSPEAMRARVAQLDDLVHDVGPDDRGPLLKERAALIAELGRIEAAEGAPFQKAAGSSSPASADDAEAPYVIFTEREADRLMVDIETYIKSPAERVGWTLVMAKARARAIQNPVFKSSMVQTALVEKAARATATADFLKQQVLEAHGLCQKAIAEGERIAKAYNQLAASPAVPMPMRNARAIREALDAVHTEPGDTAFDELMPHLTPEGVAIAKRKQAVAQVARRR